MKKQSYGQKIVLAFMTFLISFGFAAPARAHGVVITYTLKANGEVELHAEFDTGEPMAEGQVTVYSPEDPLTPWLTGTADAEGRYLFVIDPEIPGIWDIQYRKAGHGDIVHLQLEEGMIDPALIEHPPGELQPAALAVETIPTESETQSEADTASSEAPETGPMAVADATKVVGNVVDAAEEGSANDPALSAVETEADVAEANTEEIALEAQVSEPPAEEGQIEMVPLTEAEPVVEPEVEAQVEAEPAIDTDQTETAAQVAPEPASRPGESGEVTVLSSGGNTATTGGFTSFQIILMSASVIWGFMGTALYFSGRKTQDRSHTYSHRH